MNENKRKAHLVKLLDEKIGYYAGTPFPPVTRVFCFTSAGGRPMAFSGRPEKFASKKLRLQTFSEGKGIKRRLPYLEVNFEPKKF